MVPLPGTDEHQRYDDLEVAGACAHLRGQQEAHGGHAVPSAMTAFWERRRSSTRLVSCDDRKTEIGIGRKASPVTRGE